MNAHHLGVYGEPAAHEAVSNIIRRHSTNPGDVRAAALDGLDLGRVSRLLDLGCGFGFFVAGLDGRLPVDADVVGIDLHDRNREAFLARARAVARSAEFLCATLDDRLDFPDRSFDAVVASYSLYFFPGVIPDVARVLKPGGVFVALTHSESAFARLLAEIGCKDPELRQVLLEFSAENGAARLAPHFGRVETRPYPNRLVFEAADADDLLGLLAFKLPSMTPAGSGDGGPSTAILDRARHLLERRGRLTIAKDDAVFLATEPRS